MSNHLLNGHINIIELIANQKASEENELHEMY